MGQALYRKYRPRNFSEVIGQEAITKTLDDALKSGRINHAYLFAGPRGVGKTSFARILAHAVNDIAYTQDATHLDIIEIDAASNRRIDEIRDLREKVHIAPSLSKYKVYIIDEVHMLTKEAFNALLKTLEEPPAHCIFILATTEAHRLPETIISRTQRFNFKPLDVQQMRGHLQMVAKKEKIDIDEQALDLLASHGEGSLRDILGMLDQLSSAGTKITEAEARNLLGIPPQETINELMDNLLAGDTKAALDALESLKEQGANAGLVAKALSQQLRQNLLDGQISGEWPINLMERLLDIASSSQPQESLELAVLEAAARSIDKRDQPSQKPPDVNDTPNIKSASSSQDFDLGQWSQLLSMVRSEAPSLYNALRLAAPSLEDGRLLLAFPFPLHQKKVKEAKQISLIARLIESLSGAKLPIECIVDKQLVKIESDRLAVVPIEKTDLQTISNIFGSTEVLES